MKPFADVDTDRAEAAVQRAQLAGREFLSAAEANELLEAYGIPVARWRTAEDAAAAAEAAAEIGFPVVVKADSETIVHKSDVGGVAVNLGDAEATRFAAERMERGFGTADLRFFVQEYLEGGKEVIVGADCVGNGEKFTNEGLQ